MRQIGRLLKRETDLVKREPKREADLVKREPDLVNWEADLVSKA